MVNETIYGGERHRLIWKNPSPFPEGLIGGDQQRSPFVPGADQFEQHARFRLILGDVGEIVEDEQMILVEFGDRRFEEEIAPRDLELLHEVRRPGEQHAPAVFDRSRRGREPPPSAIFRLQEGRNTKIGAIFQPGISGGERVHLRL